MRKKESPPVLKYWGTIGLLGISLTGCAISAIFALDALSKGESYAIPTVIAFICGLSIPVINKIQLKLRDKVEYNEFGQSRKHGDFSKLSAAERRKIEEAKMIDSERILPSSELQSMTHKGSKTPEEDIEKLIGLPQVKKMMNELAAQMAYDQEFNSKKNKKEIEAKAYHMCFSGPPGTGKTTVARIMAGLLYKYKIIRENKCIETDGNTFHGSTPAEATLKTQKILHRASGGVLFIDEAYALMADTGGTNREVVATLIKEMEDNRDGIVIILAGYENEMKSLIESNPGFKSRIQQFYNFTAYNVEDLKKIFEKMSTMEGYGISEMAYGKFEELIDPMRRSKHFGNGRTVRNIVQSSIDKHKVNCMKETFENKEAKEKRVKTLAYEDICAPRTI